MRSGHIQLIEAVQLSVTVDIGPRRGHLPIWRFVSPERGAPQRKRTDDPGPILLAECIPGWRFNDGVQNQDIGVGIGRA